MEPNLNLEKIKMEIQVLYRKEFSPKILESNKWHMWKTTVTNTTCFVCYEKSGTIFNDEYMIDEFPPLHEKCRCFIIKAEAICAGTATVDGFFGADYFVKNFEKLPPIIYLKERLKQKVGNHCLGICA